MLLRVLMAFLLLQVADIFALVWLGRSIGVWSTLGLLAVMGTLGSALARHEGMRVWRGWHAALERGRAPEEGVVSGMLVLLGGLLLVAPGFGTDVLGLILLLPATRRPLAALVSRRLQTELAQHSAGAARSGAPFAPPLGDIRSPVQGGVDVIDTTGVESPDLEPPHARADRALGK